jgi:hypothetical protein
MVLPATKDRPVYVFKMMERMGIEAGGGVVPYRAWAYYTRRHHIAANPVYGRELAETGSITRPRRRVLRRPSVGTTTSYRSCSLET